MFTCFKPSLGEEWQRQSAMIYVSNVQCRIIEICRLKGYSYFLAATNSSNKFVLPGTIRSTHQSAALPPSVHNSASENVPTGPLPLLLQELSYDPRDTFGSDQM